MTPHHEPRPSISRRSFTASVAAIAASLALPRAARAQPTTASVPEGSWLLFMKSSGFEHDIVKPQPDGPNQLARQLGPILDQRKLNLLATKDGRHFEPDEIGRYAGFIFYTTGDLTTPGTDGRPPMSAAGVAALLKAIESGTPFIGLHCASDTFHAAPGAEPSAFTRMLGGEFDAHGEQQAAVATITDASFPGVGKPDDWIFVEEWYALKSLAADIHPILTLQTAGMKGDMYRRDPFPNTWTRMHGKGRVFYTAIGHREEVIASKAWQGLIGGALDWCRTAGT